MSAVIARVEVWRETDDPEVDCPWAVSAVEADGEEYRLYATCTDAHSAWRRAKQIARALGVPAHRLDSLGLVAEVSDAR